MSENEQEKKIAALIGKAEAFAFHAETASGAAANSANAAAASALAASQFDPSANKVEPEGKHINDYVEDINFFSGKVSDIIRSLALAGIAITWIFRNTDVKKINPVTHATEMVPPDHLFQPVLYDAVFFLVLALIVDLFQYTLAYAFWKIFYEIKRYNWKKKKTISEEEAKDISAPYWMSITLIVIFAGKIVLTGVAYYYIYSFLKLKA